MTATIVDKKAVLITVDIALLFKCILFSILSKDFQQQEPHLLIYLLN